jgi:hypothetical protein
MVLGDHPAVARRGAGTRHGPPPEAEQGERSELLRSRRRWAMPWWSQGSGAWRNRPN